MPQADITARLRRRIVRDFGDDATRVEGTLMSVHSGSQDRERVLAAVVLGASGDFARLGRLAELSRVDWRDLLVGSGLADDDWPAVLERELGP